MKLSIKKANLPGRWPSHWSWRYLFGFAYIGKYCVTLDLRMKKKPSVPKPLPSRHVGDDYTPGNVSGAPFIGFVFFGVLMIIALLVIAAVIGIEERKSADCYHVIDRETVSVAERPPIGTVYIKTEKRYFYPGDRVTSKPNGALILWDSLTMHPTLIVGVISDSGTIKHYNHE